MKIITEKQLEELRLKAKGGNNEKKVAYAQAKKQYNELKDLLFNDEYPYVKSPDNEYLKRLEKEAETGGDVEKARYEMLKANREARDKNISGETGRNFRLQRQKIAEAVTNDETVSKELLEEARVVCAKNPNKENLTRYATLKRKLAEQQKKAE